MTKIILTTFGLEELKTKLEDEKEIRIAQKLTQGGQDSFSKSAYFQTKSNISHQKNLPSNLIWQLANDIEFTKSRPKMVVSFKEGNQYTSGGFLDEVQSNGSISSAKRSQNRSQTKYSRASNNRLETTDSPLKEPRASAILPKISRSRTNELWPNNLLQVRSNPSLAHTGSQILASPYRTPHSRQASRMGLDGSSSKQAQESSAELRPPSRSGAVRGTTGPTRERSAYSKRGGVSRSVLGGVSVSGEGRRIRAVAAGGAGGPGNGVAGEVSKKLLLASQFREIVDAGGEAHRSFLSRRCTNAVKQLDEFQTIMKGSGSAYRLFRFLNPSAPPSSLNVLSDRELVSKSTPILGRSVGDCQFLLQDPTVPMLAKSISRKFGPICQAKARLNQTVRTYHVKQSQFREFRLCTNDRDNFLKQTPPKTDVPVEDPNKVFEDYLSTKQALWISLQQTRQSRRPGIKGYAALRKRLEGRPA